MSYRRGSPQVLNGRVMRSRIETRWAAFMTLLGWDWEYEPFDLTRYAPDFVVSAAEPLLIEVKPELAEHELHAHTAKIDRSGWAGEALIVGGKVPLAHPVESAAVVCGVMSEGDGRWGPAWMFRCGQCQQISVCHSTGSFHCRMCGYGGGDRHIGPAHDAIVEMWAEAGNAVQWRPPKLG